VAQSAKSLLARGLATKPSILSLHEPTRGILLVMSEIYNIISSLRRSPYDFAGLAELPD